MIQNAFMKRLGMSIPVIQAPLAGGGDTPTLVAAVSESGGLGMIGAAYLPPPRIHEAVKAVRALSRRPFGLNLFAPGPDPATPANLATALHLLAPHFEALGLPPPSAPAEASHAFPEQFEAAVQSGLSVFSFTFGLLPSAAVQRLTGEGVFVLGTATTVEEAMSLEQSGVDAIVAQGAEAGGHRGTFRGSFESALIGTIALVPQIVDAVRIPVIASGGIMDGRGIAAALALGASAVQMGTAFLTCDEAGIPEAYKNAILHGKPGDTRITRAFSGRPARGIVNSFMQEMDAYPEALLDFPLQNTLTRPLRAEAARQGRAEFLSLWAGQGLGMARRQTARELMQKLEREITAVVQRLLQ